VRRALLALAVALVAVLPAVTAEAAPTARRISGADRYETAANVSRDSFPNGAPVAYVATGVDFPDALAAAPVAKAEGGPVLLVTRDTVPAATRTELDRLKPQRVVVLGGPAAVSEVVRIQLNATRVQGEDRYDTAARLSAGRFQPGAPVHVATGTGFADALAGGAAAAAANGPVLLVTPGVVPETTKAELQRLQPSLITILGGQAAVADVVEAELKTYSANVVRRQGVDRYATSAAVSAGRFPSPTPTVYVTTGANFADALAAGPAAGKAGGPVLLVPGSCITPEVKAEIDRLNPQTMVVLGGGDAVGAGVEQLQVCAPASLQDARVKLTEVARFSQPLDMATRPGDPAVYFAEKGGRVRRLGPDGSNSVIVEVAVSTGGEQGLLGIVFGPDGSKLYLNYTDPAGDTQIVEVDMAGGARRTLMSVDQPFANHNGGAMKFGPDGKLYIALGDGGSGNDPQNNAQRLDTVLGKILRIDPAPSASLPYTIPADNPFAGQTGRRGEVWHFGLRNPWRFSFDRGTGDMWIGDVGQGQLEEVDFRPAGSPGGANFGWKHFEGTRLVFPPAPADHVPPILEYSLEGPNCAVTGGFVYRGGQITGLDGAYLYADFCVGRIFAVRQDGGRIVESKDLGITVSNLASFGEDNAGNLYALSLGGVVHRLDQG
jgi:putative cell wall-binding protein/glucose/arabinose dehydrogenase